MQSHLFRYSRCTFTKHGSRRARVCESNLWGNLFITPFSLLTPKFLKADIPVCEFALPVKDDTAEFDETSELQQQEQFKDDKKFITTLLLISFSYLTFVCVQYYRVSSWAQDRS